MKKVIARIKGGIGNQLFCYAAARRLAVVNGADLAIDGVSGFRRDQLYRRRYMLDRFRIPVRKATPGERLEPLERYRRGMAKALARRQPFQRRRYVEQEGRDFDPRLLLFRVCGAVHLDGLWQSESYFKDVEAIIRADLQIIPPGNVSNRRVAAEIRDCNAVAVHVRWFEAPRDPGAGHNASLDYYRRAMDEIRGNVSDPRFFLFSDDPASARVFLNLREDHSTLVDHNRGDEHACADLWLMSQCKHFVIANSTFSWWGAWLSPHPDKIVIAPGGVQSGVSSWGFHGLIPEKWITI
jgi:hypothetical protein